MKNATPHSDDAFTERAAVSVCEPQRAHLGLIGKGAFQAGFDALKRQAPRR